MSKINKTMKDEADAFILNWRGTKAERSEAQTFCNEFFEIFGLYRKDYALFEKPIRKKGSSGTGFADLFWKGKLIIESKSAHLDSDKNWKKTLEQATEYVHDLKPYQRPKYILLMNFKRIQKHAVEVEGDKINIHLVKEIPIEKLAVELDEFQFFLDFAEKLEKDEEEVNKEAANLIANVYDSLSRKGHNTEEVAIFLSRILFCLFAEDTGIFENNQFENYLRELTSAKTIGDHIDAIFETLNTPIKSREKLTKDLSAFPFVNGNLFSSDIKIPPMGESVREALIKCSKYDWSDVSPVIFGSLFQAILSDVDRRTLGAHYTSEKNILRVIEPLFLDDLRTEMSTIKRGSKIKLNNYRKKIGKLYFLDPACGCGNFLVVAYKELRLLDIEIVKRQYGGTYVTDASLLKNIKLNQFYGYEIDKTSSMIAEVSMWLAEHQMNMTLESVFGSVVPTIPLDEGAIITADNALQIEWNARVKNIKGVDVIPTFNFILGNPPFIGKHLQTTEQKEDMKLVFENVKGAGVLDYVAAWYIKAAQYNQAHPSSKIGLVSTNSITQGEQPGILWNELFNNYKMKIIYAHRTFKWHNEAEGVAAVHCVIIGFAMNNENIPKTKPLFDYTSVDSEPKKINTKNINPYLVAGGDIVVTKRSKPLCDVPPLKYGNKIVDGGNLLFNDEEKKEFLKKEPKAKKFVKPILSGEEFINGRNRWVLYLNDATPKELQSMPHVMERIKNVKKYRLDSTKAQTREAANIPHLFAEPRQPVKDFLIIPRTSSENRQYIPFGFFSPKFIVNDSCTALPNATIYHFGVMTSSMHMLWVKYVCGRLKSDYRYSNSIVYNNFPWPSNINAKLKKAVETKSKKVLDERVKHPTKSLAELYNPKKMPVDLLKAHQALDKAVDLCYSTQSFKTEKKRMEFLFKEYHKLI